METTGISLEEAKAVANALYLGETERLFREVALADVLELTAKALRRGQGLIGDTAADVVREFRHSYPNAGLLDGEVDRGESAHPTLVREILIHEIAHALVGQREGDQHDEEFRVKLWEIRCTPVEARTATRSAFSMKDI